MQFDELFEKAAQSPKKIAVAAAADREVLLCVVEALKRKMASFSLIGESEKIKEILQSLDCHTDDIEIIDCPSTTEAAAYAANLVSEGKADVLMKGLLQTSELLHAVLNPDIQLRSGKLLSHVAMLSSPEVEHPLFLSDAAMVISPTLEEKAAILQNSVKVAHALGIAMPKVAVIGAVEMVNPKMPATIDAAVLTQMNRRGQIRGCVVDGPLGLDNAISLTSAQHKGIQSEVAGKADILIVPDIQTGNAIYKTATYLGSGKAAGVIVGAKAPIVLTSRADSAEAKLCSIAMAACL